MAERKPPCFLCGVPKDKCAGTLSTVNAALGGNKKAHTSSEDAFACHRRFLVGEGYKQVGTRAFDPQNGGPVLIISKKSRFGARLRNGKEGTRNMSGVRAKGNGARGGVIVG